MSQLNPEIDHLLRRAGFGVSPADAETFRDMSTSAAIAHLVDYEGRPDDVDARIGRADHAQVVSKDLFAPDIDIDDARQRWMFRMIHTRRPLQDDDAADVFQRRQVVTSARGVGPRITGGEEQGRDDEGCKNGQLHGSLRDPLLSKCRSSVGPRQVY